MKLPLNWLKELIDYGKKSPQELAEIFTLLGHEVEKIEDPAKNLDKIVVGKVLKIEKHPNADKLRVVKCQMSNVKCNIVCGGSNLHEGMTTVVALPGARVRWHGQGDLAELKETEIRGVRSVGMICASTEIGLETLFPAKDEREIVDLSGLNLKDGDPLAKALQLGPILHLDITPNRADCLSIIGLARDLGAALGRELRIKNQELGSGRKELTNFGKSKNVSSFKIHVSSRTLCPKYTVQAFTDVQVVESPWSIQSRLWASGIRPINNLVDITNYIMLETGEPMHVFDLDKLNQKQHLTLDNKHLTKKVDIMVRNAKNGEKLKALDGKTYDLDETMLVIADAEKPVAIAGVMGGEETGVTAETKNVVFEAAIFDPVLVRKTSRKLGLRSESSVRFERGIPLNYPELAQARARAMLAQISNFPPKADPPLADKCQISDFTATPASKPIFISQTVGVINQMLNIHLAPARVKSILTSLGFTWRGGEKFKVAVPPWRLDIKIHEDLYEEVGRLYGLNKLRATLPHGELKPAPQNPLRKLTEAARDELRALGYDEVYTYSFYGHDTLEKDGTSLRREPHVNIENPINPSQEFLRTNLTRNLLDATSRNARIFDEVKIFEIGKVFHSSPRSEKSESHPNDSKLSLPHEETHLALVAMQKGARREDLYRKFKGDVVALIGKQVRAEFKQMDGGLDIFFDDKWVGWMGILDETRQTNWKIKDPCAIAEFNLDAVLKAPFYPLRYKPTSEFPPALRDLAFTVSEKVEYMEVETLLKNSDPLIASVELFDIYRGKSLGENKKSFALHITLQSLEKTLSEQEIDAVLGRLQLALQSKLCAEIRS